jgi:predicted aminopeptidase
VSYRGYFDEARATREAGKLRGKGYDVFVGPSIAYSTLGHLRDPVLNTMFGYGDSELAAFIFHELAHQAVYAAGDSDFNEAFATVVETEGLERWLAHETAPPISTSSSRQGRASATPRTEWSPRGANSPRSIAKSLIRPSCASARPPSSRSSATHSRPAATP